MQERRQYRPGKAFQAVDDDADADGLATAARSALKSVPAITSLDFDQIGELVLAAHGTNRLTVLNWDDPMPIPLLVNLEVYCARFHPIFDKDALVAPLLNNGNANRTLLCMLDLSVKTVSTVFKEGHSDQIRAIEFLPKSNYFLSASGDGTVRLWSARHASNSIGVLRRPDALTSSLRTTGESPPAIAWDAKRAHFATASPGSPVVRLYDLRQFARGPFLTAKVHRLEDICSLRFSIDSFLLFCTSRAGAMVAIRTEDGSMVYEVACLASAITRPCCSPLGGVLAVPTATGIDIVKANTGAVAQRIATHGLDLSSTIEWNPTHDAFASSGNDAFVLWRAVEPDGAQ